MGGETQLLRYAQGWKSGNRILIRSLNILGPIKKSLSQCRQWKPMNSNSHWEESLERCFNPFAIIWGWIDMYKQWRNYFFFVTREKGFIQLLLAVVIPVSKVTVIKLQQWGCNGRNSWGFGNDDTTFRDGFANWYYIFCLSRNVMTHVSDFLPLSQC